MTIKKWLRLLNEGYMEEFKKIDEMWNKTKNAFDFIDELKLDGMTPLGRGATRIAYSKPDLDYVVKIYDPTHKSYSNPNEGDVDITLSKYNTELRDIIPKVLHASKDNTWIIVEKVKPVGDLSYEEIQKVFPTAKSLMDKLNELGVSMEQRNYKDIVYSMLFPPSKIAKEIDYGNKKWRNTIKSIIFINLSEILRLDKNQQKILIKALQTTKLQEDVYKIWNAMKVVQTHDLNLRNIGVSLDMDIGPGAIRFLDFDYINFA
jgi:hypothetical protein